MMMKSEGYDYKLKVTHEEYNKMASDKSKTVSKGRNMLFAFLVGGFICTIGQLLHDLYTKAGLNELEVKAAVPVTLIAASIVLTGLGIYDKIAKHAGAGTIVPITGFANAVVSPAMEFKSEGQILGVGAKMFIMAGPVLVFGISSAVIYGLVIFIFKLA